MERKYISMDKNHPHLPHSTYAVSKMATDRAVFTLHNEQGFPVTIIRPFNSYDPHVTQPYIIPEIILQLLRGDCVSLGNTDSSKDFAYVGDTVRGIMQAFVENKAGGQTITSEVERIARLKTFLYE